ncbi:beta-ketoacyl synthase N-terminal-like domain-containing protein [Nonomuraea sp. B12E4]|uniref:beta-ketoacyl synthase N-terminal-like domain-containing protein n=1 Tax=Nonomuraea sp. B12E4 TaxID=3153564 RepID=UPI00325F4BC1
MSVTAVEAGTPVITGWSAVSPFGVGRAAFVEGMLSGRRTDTPAGEWDGAGERACLVPGFDARETLGAKGTRAMDRVTGLAVTTVGELLEEYGGTRTPEPDPETALVLGTTTGSAQSMMSFTRASLTGAKPFHVEPAVIPNSVMNCAAGRCAIWYKLKGPNATIAGGRAAGLFSLVYTRRLLLTGRARRVLCGAVEEYSRARSWLEFHSRGREHSVLSEGCAVFQVEPAGQVGGTPLAAVLAVDTRVSADGDPAGAMRACVNRVLSRGGVEPSALWAACPSNPGGAAGAAEREVLTTMFGRAALERIPRTAMAGDPGAASVPFQLASALALAQRDPAPHDRPVLVTAADPDGAVAAALVLLLADGAR